MHAHLYDTKTSAKTPVTLQWGPTDLIITADYASWSYAIDEVQFSDRLGTMPRKLYLPNGQVCEVEDNDAIDALLKEIQRNRGPLLLHALESKLRYVVGALMTTMVFTYAFITYGLPTMAQHVAHQIPASIVSNLSHGTLNTLDNLLFKPSKLPLQRQEALRTYFNSYVHHQEVWPNIHLEFRSGSIGPNAFALPDGTIVFTDALVHLAEHDEELLSIFFHELGHIEERHAIRTLLQDSVFYLLVTAFTGDVTAVSSILAALPTMLVESHYSQSMETEADLVALTHMRRHHIPPIHFANIMERLTHVHPEDTTALQYLSTHPQTSERIQAFKNPE